MNWKKATLAQLYEIAFHDTGAKIEHKRAAAEEIIRRRKRKRKYEQTEYRRKTVYV